MSFTPQHIRSLPRVASIATMPTRLLTFLKVLDDILPQVDRAYVYLDHFPRIPSYLLTKPKVENISNARSW